ncbi:MAG: hypothetical protein MSC50_02155 [Campylobacter sp.]|uniref:hypothetical protein n=1 Tax=Campylobacter sp. TaxID=205 RepID=UPI002A8C7A8A|nr:hypothetical protein [Campylobacter sp.]MCI6579065.1 hypothetical protein [Campylobacter sp.]MDY4154205.1 hypothetical protein [Campylobacter sp.]
MRLLRFARNDENSRIPYRDPRGDPRVKPEDDIVRNSRIPYRDPPVKLGDDIVRNFRIPRL